ncbi:hypothetical protein [Kiloniella sp. EL199]|uniref:hypothetical protein n=1 Tax=Kiloniella sp. EL199 TaxID=2107581 RepID=UPI000EA3F122|nr:hypothetical protein [Kiloniella sp. EL199]
MPGYSSPSGHGSDIGDRRSNSPGRGPGGNPGGGRDKKDWSKRNADARARAKAQKAAKPKEVVKEKKGGWKPTPNIEEMEFYDPTLDWQQNVDRYNQSQGIGKYGGNSNSKLGFHEMRNRSQLKTPAAKQAYSQRIAEINHPVQSALRGFLSQFVPGVVASKLTYDAQGNLADYTEFDPIDMATDLLAVGSNPGIGKAPQMAYGALRQVGYGAKPYASIRSLSDGMAQAAQSSRQQMSQRNSSNTTSRSVYDRAAQQLYLNIQNEDDLPNLGIGVSQGKPKVRRAPKLSKLKARRANFGRVR